MSQPHHQFVLASTSPRRRLLLSMAGYDFAVISPDIPEIRAPDETAEAFVVRLAQEKAAAVADELPSGVIVLGFDTAVVLGEQIYGKPADEAAAAEMLLALGGRTHTVFTGYCLIVAQSDMQECGIERSLVTMRGISVAEAAEYAATGEPLDKAGSYALQGLGKQFVAKIDGPKSTVIGLPLERIVDLLSRFGVLPQHPVGA